MLNIWPGPIYNPNPGYRTDVPKNKRTSDIANGKRLSSCQIQTRLIACTAALNAHMLSKKSGWICWISVNGEQICGKTFRSGPTVSILAICRL